MLLHKKAHSTVTLLTDFITIGVFWIGTFFLRFYGPLPSPKGIPPSSTYFKLIPFLWVMWFLASLFTQDKQSTEYRIVDGLSILKQTVFMLMGFLGITYFYSEYFYSRQFLLLFAILCPVGVYVGRLYLFKSLMSYQKRQAHNLLLVVGKDTMEQAFNVAKAYHGAKIIGIICVDGSPNKKAEVPFLSLPADWVEFFTECPCQSVIIALPLQSYAFVEQHLDVLCEQVADIKLVPDIAKYRKFSAGIDMVANTPVINIHESPLVGFGSILKRLMDFVGAFVALIIFSPIMLVCTVLIKLSSPGPVLYKQKRMGLDGKLFSIYKFRSMPVFAEEKTGVQWSSKNDNRPTPIGRLMRKTSLDEVPQFYNVLRGDMSLVGPRPERPQFVQTFRKDIPGYMLRHKVKAGITGWAQINGWRGDTSIEKRIECDLYYIQNWSLMFDIKIVFLTVFKGFTSPNAY